MLIILTNGNALSDQRVIDAVKQKIVAELVLLQVLDGSVPLLSQEAGHSKHANLALLAKLLQALQHCQYGSTPSDSRTAVQNGLSAAPLQYLQQLPERAEVLRNVFVGPV